MFGSNKAECRKMGEHIHERNWPDIGRRYSDRQYTRLKLRVFHKEIAEVRHAIPVVEEDMVSHNEGEAARTELAAGEGQVA